MQEVKIEDLKINPFTMVGKEWMLINTKSGDEINSMTAAWGGMGYLWNKNVVYLFVRPQRYTKKLIDRDDVEISLSFFNGEHKKELVYLGSVSAYNNKNKAKECGLTLINDDVATYKEATLTFKVKKLYRQTIDKNSFIDKEVDLKQYPLSDYHDMYVCEVEKVFVD